MSRASPSTPNADLSAYDMLIVGKSALTVDGPAPRIGRVRDGLKVIVFEQTAQVLEKRLGFRVAEYGLRQVFPRLPDHPLLAGIAAEHLRDWRGEATILPPRLDYEMRPRYGPTVKWCDIPVTRVWRCGNRGNVASVLIEKPARGNFLPILDGGFSLQYSPLLEYREGQGLVLFCQLDVTGRTETDPAAESLARNILQYVVDLEAGPRAGKSSMPAIQPGSAISNPRASPWMPYAGAKLSPDQVLVVGPGGGRKLAASAPAIADWLKAGGNVLAIGLDEQEANAFLPFKVRMKKAEHIAAYFDPFDAQLAVRGSRAGGCPQPRPPGAAPRSRREPRSSATASWPGRRASTSSSASSCPGSSTTARKPNVKRTYRRASFLVSRLLANMGVDAATPILARFLLPWPARPRNGAGEAASTSTSPKNGTTRTASSAGEWTVVR